jgi:hypothetical protein
VFLTLLLVTFLISAFVSLLAARGFMGPVRRILSRLVSEELSIAWQRYIMFAIFVVGLSGGVRINSLEQYIMPQMRGPKEALTVIQLDTNRWVLEVYRTIIETLQAIAWMLLVFFLVALVAYVILRSFELKAAREDRGADLGP